MPCSCIPCKVDKVKEFNSFPVIMHGIVHRSMSLLAARCELSRAKWYHWTMSPTSKLVIGLFVPVCLGSVGGFKLEEICVHA